jgi:uncharacterized protein (TIGR00661 family)
MKILYGVPSEGMGHATRSKVVIEHLLALGHEVIVVTSDRAYTFLSNLFGTRVLQIEGFHMAYKNAKVSSSETAKITLKNAPKQLLKNLTVYFKVLKHHQFDAVISDFESFTNFYAKWHNCKLISIDNMQVINRATLDIKIPKAEQINHQIAKAIIKVKVPKADNYLITSFFTPELRKKRTQYVPPIIRQAVIDAKPSKKNHILIYQTSTSQQDLVAQLHLHPKEYFYVFGFNKDEVIKNVHFKKFSEEEFIKLFASAKAVMANGGFSFISEAVYMHKPILSVPIANQFEQFVNASYIQQLGYGMHAANFTASNISHFLQQLPTYQTTINQYTQAGNEILFAELATVLATK